MIALWESVRSTASAVGGALLVWFWHATLLLAGACLVARALRRRSAGLRALLWLTVLLALPWLPLVARVTPLRIASLADLAPRLDRTPRTPTLPAHTDVPPPPPSATALNASQANSPTGGSDMPPQPGRASLARVLLPGVAAAWALGTIVLLARLLVATLWLRREGTTSRELDLPWLDSALRRARVALGLRRPVLVTASRRVSAPVTAAVPWPLVILPAALVQRRDQDLIEHALYHELAHVGRGDAVVTLYRRLLEAVFFFHPLLWIASRSYELEQERVCDDRAAAALGDPHQYARSLGELAADAAEGACALAPSFAYRPGIILGRITRLLEARKMTNPKAGVRGVATVAVILAALLIASTSFPLRDTSSHAQEFKVFDSAADDPEAPADAAPAKPKKKILKHGEGKMAGKRSLGGSGHFIRFTRPEGAWRLSAVQVFGARYGYPQPPKEDFTITLCDNNFKTVAWINKPYSTFKRGKERWVPIPVAPIELPAVFWINLNFSPGRTKGVYVGYDDTADECFSMTGLPDKTPRDIPEGYNWMVRLTITNTPPAKITKAMGEWKKRAAAATLTGQGLLELKRDDGESNGMKSIGGAGPAIRLEGAPPGAVLKGLRIYASRYGKGYNPKKTMATCYVFDDEGDVLLKGQFPYALFSYRKEWVDVPIEQTDVPESFSILINPDPTQYKGIYFHYDSDVQTAHSKYGVTPTELNNLRGKWDWMIRAVVAVEDEGG